MIHYNPNSHPGWGSVQVERFKNKALELKYSVQKLFIPYKKHNVWFEMRFEHVLN